MLKDKDQASFVPPGGASKPINRTDPYAPAAKGSTGTMVVWLVILLLVGGAGYWMWHQYQATAKKKAAGMRGGPGLVPVVPGTVVEKDVPIYLDGLGTVQAYNTVTVHVRVDGQLKKVNFTEGQDVKAGDLLALIDPDPTQAALDQAIAKKNQDMAQLANAQLDLKREVDLYAAKIDSQQVYATQKALVDQLDAAVKADQAAIESARVQLNYTTVNSPIDGRTGIRQVDQGNIVHATDSNGLVVITQLKPISVVFTLPEQTLADIHKQHPAGGEFTVIAVDRENTNQLGIGKLTVIDNQIDTTTATIKLKATFPNEDLNLWPGQFINARLLLYTRTNGIVVPAAVIQRGPDGPYAFVIVPGTNAPAAVATDNPEKPADAEKPAREGGDKSPGSGKRGGGGRGGNGGGKDENLTVRVQAVKVAQIDDGMALIDSGLKPGDRVVVDGQYKLQTGSKIKLSTEARVTHGSSTTSPTIE